MSISYSVEAETSMGDEGELAEITSGLVGGRQEAWGRLYALTHLPLLRLLRRALRDDGRAEEALQATFVAAIEGIGAFDPARGSVDSWLAGIARHKALEAARERQGSSLDADPADPGSVTAKAGGMDCELVSLALDELEPRYAEVLRRKYIEGESLEAIAQALGLKRPTVGTLLHRGRERFRRAYQRLVARTKEEPSAGERQDSQERRP